MQKKQLTEIYKYMHAHSNLNESEYFLLQQLTSVYWEFSHLQTEHNRKYNVL